MLTPTVSIWDALAAALNDAPGERPDNSVTPAEFAARSGYCESHARHVLSHMKTLRSVDYMANGKRAKCYVVAQR